MSSRRNGRRTPRSRLLFAALVGWTVLGCITPTSSPSSLSPSSSAQESPSTAVTASQSPGAAPLEGTPWQEELANLEPDGTRSLESALALFAFGRTDPVTAFFATIDILLGVGFFFAWRRIL